MFKVNSKDTAVNFEHVIAGWDGKYVLLNWPMKTLKWTSLCQRIKTPERG